MIEIVITTLIILVIAILLMITVRPTIDTLEVDLTDDLKEQGIINLDNAIKLLNKELPRYVYIENNKAKLKVRRK